MENETFDFNKVRRKEKKAVRVAWFFVLIPVFVGCAWLLVAKKEVDVLSQKSDSLNREIVTLQTTYRNYSDTLMQKEKLIEEKTAAVSELEKEYSSTHARMDSILTHYNELVSKYDSTNRRADEMSAYINELDNTIKQKEAYLNELKSSAEPNSIHNVVAKYEGPNSTYIKQMQIQQQQQQQIKMQQQQQQQNIYYNPKKLIITKKPQ